MNADLNQSTPEMLTVKHTAERFTIAQHYARQLALARKVNAVGAGHKVLINAQSVAGHFYNCIMINLENSSIY